MLISRLSDSLQAWCAGGLMRQRTVIDQANQNCITIDGKTAINFCSNDYLGLAKHPQVIAATINGLHHYGLGSGGSSLVSGYYTAQQELEQRFAEWLNVDQVLMFSSGYLANLGVITAIADRNSTIISDKFCHASLLDGIQLSRAKHYRYQHNDVSDLMRLANFKKPNVIITESVFSMEGDIAPLAEIIEIAYKHNAFTVVDDAHGVGVLGEKGKGICEWSGINPQKITCLVMPLGKAFNAMGAMIAGKSTVIQGVLQFARSYRYSTALPPAISVGLLTTLRLIETENWRREKLKENIEFFNCYLLSKNINFSQVNLTPIKTLVVGDNKKTLQVQRKLLEKGYYSACIRPPTVPENSSRLRVSLNALHTRDQIRGFIDCVVDQCAK